METTDQNLINILKAAVYDVNLKQLGDISPETKIAELGMDSVAMMELIGVLEENLSIRVEDAAVAELRCVGDLLRLIRDRVPSELPAIPDTQDLKRESTVSAEMTGKREFWDITAFPEVKNLEQRLAELDQLGVRNPYFHVHEGTARNRSIVEGVEMLNFSSYNYLGFSGHPEVIVAAKDAIDRYGTSVSASRLVSGERPIHRQLEKELAKHIGVDDAVVFVSGHATNVTTIGHLFDKNDLILHDSLCHDSILQGIYLSGAKRRAFSHDNTVELEQILAQVRSQYRRVLICSEGLFSMDGDICDLPRLIELKKRFQCNLIIDEAHSIGVLGPSGRGIGHHFPGIDPRDVDLWMGTLSKSFASCGGYIAGSKPLVLYLKFTAPGFLYSVGMSPPNTAAALKALELMQRHPEIVERLRLRSKLFLELARSKGVNTGFSAGAAVIPAIIGNSIQCMQLSQALAARRINVQPIVHPAVEENAARLRFFISATHSEEEIHQAVTALSEELERMSGMH
jgi:8-amino-7-oxononanoate synthase